MEWSQRTEFFSLPHLAPNESHSYTIEIEVSKHS
jgi:hypothetical protein